MIFVVISLLLGGFVVYDKLLKKEEVARELHVTCECIRQLELKALYKLKRQVSSNEKSKSLKIYYE